MNGKGRFAMKIFFKRHLFLLGCFFLCLVFAKEIIDSTSFWDLMSECGLIKPGHVNPYVSPVPVNNNFPVEILVDPSQMSGDYVGLYARQYYCQDGNITDTYKTGSIYLLHNPGEYSNTEDIKRI